MPNTNKKAMLQPEPAPMSIGELLAADMGSLNQADRARKIQAENDLLRRKAMQGNVVLLENMPSGEQVWADQSVLARPSDITQAQQAAGVGVVPLDAVLRAGYGGQPLISGARSPEPPVMSGMPVAPQGAAYVPSMQGGTVMYDDQYNRAVDQALYGPNQLKAAYEQAMRDLLMSSLVR